MISLFPERVLDSSIHTAIIVGLTVVWLLTEFLGWPFVGFVVAGYLSAILLTHVPSFFVICLEAILTYGLAWLAGRGLARTGLSFDIFGRDRFLLFVLFSVPVRLLTEGVGGDFLGSTFESIFGLSEYQPEEFHAIGLVLVPLLANTFWKLGLASGVLHTTVSVGLTYGILAGVFVPFTNLHMGRFELTFESAALDFAGSADLYILFLTTAMIAARNSLRFGWDVGGILVPSLIALTITEPSKFLATIVEVVVLVLAYRLLRKIPALARLDLEGPRTLFAVCLLSYALKFSMSWLSVLLAQPLYVSDFFGFGYLLTALLAARCIAQNQITRVVMPAIVTAVQGFTVGSIVLLVIPLANPLWPWSASSQMRSAGEPTGEPQHAMTTLSPGQLVLLAHSTPQRGHNSTTSVSYSDILQEKKVIETLNRLGETHDIHISNTEGLRVLKSSEHHCLWMRRQERTDALKSLRSSPALLWCGGDGPLLAVPHPLSDPDSLWSAAYLADHARIAGVLIAGADGDTHTKEHSKLSTSFKAWRAALGKSPVIHVISCAEKSYLTLKGGQSPPSGLGQVLKGLQLRFGGDNALNKSLWTQLREEDALLCLNPSLVLKSWDEIPIETLNTWLQRVSIPSQHTDNIHQGRPQEGMGFASVLLRAALLWARQAQAGEPPPRRLSLLAAFFNYDVRSLQTNAGKTLWALSPSARRFTDDEAPTAWGSIILRPGAQSFQTILAPGIDQDPAIALIAYKLFAHLHATALWLGNNREDFGYTEQRRLRSLHSQHSVVRELLQGPWPEKFQDNIAKPSNENTQVPSAMPSLRALVVLPLPQGYPRAKEALLSNGGILTATEERHFRHTLGLSETLQKGRHPRTHAYALEYLRTLHHEGGLALWISASTLSAYDGSPLKELRLENYRNLGVSIQHKMPTSPQRTTIKTNWQGLLRRHIITGERAPLRRLQDRGVRLEVFDYNGHLVWVARDKSSECHISNSFGTVAQGCWIR